MPPAHGRELAELEARKINGRVELPFESVIYQLAMDAGGLT